MGAPDGFDEFVQAQSRRLLRTAWLLTGEWASAEDLVQTALAATWPRWETIHADARAAYVRRAILTTYLRGRERRWTGEIAHAELPEVVADDAYSQSDARDALRRAMQDLPPRQRAVIALRYFEDLSEQDTARALGCSVGAVKSHAAKAIARLRETPLLQGEGVRE